MWVGRSYLPCFPQSGGCADERVLWCECSPLPLCRSLSWTIKETELLQGVQTPSTYRTLFPLPGTHICCISLLFAFGIFLWYVSHCFTSTSSAFAILILPLKPNNRNFTPVCRKRVSRLCVCVCMCFSCRLFKKCYHPMVEYNMASDLVQDLFSVLLSIFLRT